MRTSYLLPCSCGKKIEVDANQSGLAVRCQCGVEQTVPTLRGLAVLERVESADLASAKAGPTWSLRQGLIFLGLVVLVGALIGWLVLRFTIRPQPITPFENFREFNRQYINELAPETLIAEWDKYRKGIEDPEWRMAMEYFLTREREYHQALYVVAFAAAVGVVILIIGLCVPRTRAAQAGRR